MVTTPSPLCLDKELRPQERILAHADKASGCFPNLCPWLKSFLASHSPSIPSLPSFSPSSFFPFFLSFSLPFFSASPVACRSCRARVLALSKANSGVHCWAVFSAPVPRSVGGPQLSPKTGREATPRRSSCAPDFKALGAEGGQGGAFFGAGPSRKPAVNSRTAAPHPRHHYLRQVQKGRAGLACGGPTGAEPAPLTLVRPAPPRVFLGDHGNWTRASVPCKIHSKSNLPWLRRGALSAAGRFWFPVCCSRSFENFVRKGRPVHPPSSSAASEHRGGSPDLGRLLPGCPR